MNESQVEEISVPDATDEDLRRLAEEVKQRDEHSVNDLHRLIIVAEVLAGWYRANVRGTLLEAVFEKRGWGPALTKLDARALMKPAETIEVAGILGLYSWLSKRQELNVLFVNDLAQEIHGLDAVAHDPNRNRFVLLESKGTTRRLKHAPAAYLRLTKTKGRQLSLNWCWRSLVDFACFAPTAPIFLRLLNPFFDGRCERILVVTQVTVVDGGYSPGISKSFEEAAIREALTFDDATDYSKQRKWLAEIQSSGQFPDFDYHWPPF